MNKPKQNVNGQVVAGEDLTDNPIAIGRTYMIVEVSPANGCKACAFNPEPENARCAAEGCQAGDWTCSSSARDTDFIAIDATNVVYDGNVQQKQVNQQTTAYDFSALSGVWTAVMQPQKTKEEHENEVYAKHKLWQLPLIVNGYHFMRTSFACPEAYDVYAPNGTMMAHVRLRHSRLQCTIPDIGGIVVYEELFEPDEDKGVFNTGETMFYLKACAEAITEWVCDESIIIADRIEFDGIKEVF